MQVYNGQLACCTPGHHLSVCQPVKAPLVRCRSRQPRASFPPVCRFSFCAERFSCTCTFCCPTFYSLVACTDVLTHNASFVTADISGCRQLLEERPKRRRDTQSQRLTVRSRTVESPRLDAQLAQPALRQSCIEEKEKCRFQALHLLLQQAAAAALPTLPTESMPEYRQKHRCTGRA